MKKLQKLLVVVALAGLLSACGKDDEPVAETKGKCNVFECIKKLDVNNTLDEINKTIGIDGKQTSDTEYSTTYTWKLSDDTSIDATITKSDNSVKYKISYPTKSIVKRADFSKWSDIKSKLNSKEGLTYDEFVKLVGGVEGTLTDKSSSSLTYDWYNKDGGYLFAYFNTKDNKCTLASGRF